MKINRETFRQIANFITGLAISHCARSLGRRAIDRLCNWPARSFPRAKLTDLWPCRAIGRQNKVGR